MSGGEAFGRALFADLTMRLPPHVDYSPRLSLSGETTQMSLRLSLATLLTAGLIAIPSIVRAAQEEATAEKPKTVEVFDTVTLTLPAEWKAKDVRSRIIEHEFAVTQGEGEDAPTARITMMAAGGDIKTNIERWKGQFSGGGEAKTETMDVAGQKVHFVQLDGTFKETMGGGPFSGGRTVMREKYGMLGAIIEMKDGRKYFIKATGPEDLIEAQKEGFVKMLKEMK